MEGIYHEPPLLDGWGQAGPFYDHRFLGLDQAPYRSLYMPAQPLGPYLRTLEPLPQEGLGDIPDEGLIPDDGLSSEDEDDDNDDGGMEIYSHVDFHKTLGQQLAVWCHRSPETIAIFTPIPGDTLSTAVSFARSTLRCDPAMDRVLLLLPGQKKPLDPAVLHTAKPGCSILVVPKYDYVVTLEVTQLELRLEMVVSVTMTVRSLKARLQRERGFPIEHTDLLFHDEPMENQRHLFDYRIAHGSTIFAMLHLVYDVRVTVETFWGLNYNLYVDPCMTAAGLLNVVLRRTITQQAGDVSSYFHLTLPRHALVMYSGDGTPMKWSGCLGLYNLHDGVSFSLSTIALAHQMSIQTIPVLLDKDNLHNFLVSKFDYWSVLALKVHGLVGYPINLMRLFHGKRELDLAMAVGSYSHKSSSVRLDLSLLKSDNDVSRGVNLTFRLGSDITEVLKCSPVRTVKSVKSVLEEIGVPNATVYDFFVDGCRLPNNSRIGDVVEEYKKPIDLKLRSYPVFVHTPKSVIYKMNTYAQEALKVFKVRVQMKTSLSQTDYFMLMSGLPITDRDSVQVFLTPLTIGASVFLMAQQQSQTFLILCDDWLVKLRLPFHPQGSELKNMLWKDRNIPEGSLASVGNFLQWYFTMRASNKGLLMEVANKDTEQGDRGGRRARPRKRRDLTEARLWQQNYRQMRQLQEELEKKQHQPHHHPEPSRHRHQPHHHHNQQQLPPIQQHKSTTRKREPQGLYYATYKDGRWHRIQPEDLADNYLRAWSMPPDMGNASSRRIRNFFTQQRRKHHSAMPGLHRKGQGHDGRKEPQWVYSLQRMAREEKVEPAHARMTRKRKTKRRRAVQIK